MSLDNSFNSRMFQVWDYSVSHGGLLLRSTKNADAKSQVDILFVDVTAICLPTVIKDFEIHKDPMNAIPQGINIDTSLIGKRNIYRFISDKVSGYVIAGDMLVDESDLEYDAVSPLAMHFKIP